MHIKKEADRFSVGERRIGKNVVFFTSVATEAQPHFGAVEIPREAAAPRLHAYGDRAKLEPSQLRRRYSAQASHDWISKCKT